MCKIEQTFATCGPHRNNAHTIAKPTDAKTPPNVRDVRLLGGRSHVYIPATPLQPCEYCEQIGWTTCCKENEWWEIELAKHSYKYSLDVTTHPITPIGNRNIENRHTQTRSQNDDLLICIGKMNIELATNEYDCCGGEV